MAFGNKTVYFDPKDGKSASSKTIEGVLKLLGNRKDIEDRDLVMADFKKQALRLLKRVEDDGFIVI